MRIPKQYGKSHTDSCPFCGKLALSKNAQGIAVCTAHKDESLDIKCQCGSYVDILEGKWGAYARCFKCGNVSLKKLLALRPATLPEKKEVVRNEVATPKPNRIQQMKSKHPPRETVIRSDDPRYM